MPQTVPNRPMYGLTEPTVARNGRLCSSFSSSREMATRMARATPSMTASGSTPGCWRRRENSLKPARKICSTPESGSGLLPA
ncbi:hypothetical protein D3C84_1054460 [compost metagenome]